MRGDMTLREILEPIVRNLVAEARTGPLLISQKNCLAALGISPRAHLDNCRRPDFTPRVLKYGQLRLVDAAEYRTWLGVVGEEQRVAPPVSSSEDEADRILYECGYRPIARKAG